MRPATLNKHRGKAALFVAAALVLTACGGDDDDSTGADDQAAADETDAESDDAAADTEATDESDETADESDADASDTDEGSAEGGELAGRDTLIFGALWETPPMIGVDPDDTTVPVGLAPDLADAMSTQLGVDVEWQNMQWPAQLPGVQSGVVDALFGQVTITGERELSIVDLIPFFKTPFSLLLPEGNPEGLTQLADACGLSIGVPVGSIQSELIATINADACVPNGEDEIIPAEYQGATAAISAIQAGTVDGWLDSSTSINQVAESGAGSFATVQIPESEYPPEYTGIAVGKDQPDVSVALADSLKSLIEDGTYSDILASYGLDSNAITADEVVINPTTGTEVGVVSEEAE